VTDIITDAELVNNYAKKAMQAPESTISTQAPSNPLVELPGGLVENGEIIKTAEVRELTGVDEEAIAKAPTTGKALNVILQRGLSKLGNRDAKLEDLDNLLSGDRDAILVGIRRVTFGDSIDFTAQCPSCMETQPISIDLSTDVPVTELTLDRSWTIKTKKNTVDVTLPTGVTQKKLLENIDKTSAEINTLLLTGCVLSVNGAPSMGAATVLKLGMSERSQIVEEIISRIPGPRLGEVVKACKACGEKMATPLSLVDLFRL
jgi:hypothetical protein